MTKYTLGIDFGTLSARTVLVDVKTGEIAASAVKEYRYGEITEQLPEKKVTLPQDWALQDPLDWLYALETTVREVLESSSITKEDVIGIGVDFTSCTILPCDSEGVPLCWIEKRKSQLHAWPKLWKHHAAQDEAEQITQLAQERQEVWLPRYGGIISSEWLHPKTLQILNEAPELFWVSGVYIEGGDWIVWQLTGNLTRNACAAGYKALYSDDLGYPSNEFLASLHPQFPQLSEKLRGNILPAGEYAGGLNEEWAARLNLKMGTPVGAAIIDAHSGCVGVGVAKPEIMVMIMGTSTCHMLMSAEQNLVPGISGVVKNGIAPGFYGYEAGQVGVGDMFAWFVENGVPSEYSREASQNGLDLHQFLSNKSAEQQPGLNGLIALDWWNGCRTPIVNADLTGLIMGYTLRTKPDEIYRALIEATGFGTRLIINTFIENGIDVKEIVATGGITRNEILMQLYADITGYPIKVVDTTQGSAIGAAILGATAAGGQGGGYDLLHDAAENMSPKILKEYVVNLNEHQVYDQLYCIYVELVDYFGGSPESPMKRLRSLHGSVLERHT
jgi:L-ribulokinase